MTKTSRKWKNKPDNPVETSVVNCDSASGVTLKRATSLLQAAAEGADVVLACECFSLIAEDALPDFDTAQFGKLGSAEAGSVVAVRKDRGKIVKKRLIKATDAWLSKRIRARYWVRTKIQIDDMKPRPFSAGHGHPKRAWALWDAYMALTPRGIVGLDSNKLRRAMVVRFPFRTVRQSGLMSLLTPRFIPTGKAREQDTGGDHKVLRVTLWWNVNKR